MAQEGPMSDDGSGKWNKCGNHLVKWRRKLKAKCCLLLQKLLQVHYLFWALMILLLRISPSTWVSRRHSHQVAPSRHASVCYSPRRGRGISSEGRSLNKVFNTCDGEGLTLGAFNFSRWTRKDSQNFFSSSPLCKSILEGCNYKHPSKVFFTFCVFLKQSGEMRGEWAVGRRGRREIRQRGGGETRLEMQTASGTCPWTRSLGLPSKPPPPPKPPFPYCTDNTQTQYAYIFPPQMQQPVT